MQVNWEICSLEGHEEPNQDRIRGNQAPKGDPAIQETS